MHAWQSLDDTSILLTRTQDLEQQYKSHTQRVLAAFPTMSHYIREKILANTSGLHLTLNKFPYNLQPDITHFVLWNPDDSPLDHCRCYIHAQFSPNFFDVCLRQNMPHHRSIPDIPHYHVFIRRKSFG